MRSALVPKGYKYQNHLYWIENGIDIDRRRIRLDEDVDEYTIGWIRGAIDIMIHQNADEPINIEISSYGGSVYDGLALYDLLEDLNCPIFTHATGKVMSMGLILYLVGDRRTASPRTTFMAHAVSSGTFGKVSEMTTDLKETERLNKVNIKILADRTKKSTTWWTKEIRHIDQYYDVTQALKIGIITEEN
jgi:ATP-dependent Clp protease protease subunit